MKRIDHEQCTPKCELREIINPLNLPEAGFQSYREFVNNATEQRDNFLAGKVRNPHFTYPKFYQLSRMDKGIISLSKGRDEVDRSGSSQEVRDATNSSLEFRMAEMEFVKMCARLDYLAKNEGSKEDISQLGEEIRKLNAELYGVPKFEIADAALNELYGIIESKLRHPSAEKIYQELISGNGCIALPRAKNPEIRLPRFENNEALEWASEQVWEQNSDIIALVEAYWEQAIEEEGEDYVCSPEDIVEVFQCVIDMRDPSGESGVSVKLVEGKTSLSWESPEMAVCVGANRAAIKSADGLARAVLHEFGVHGQRAVNGLQSELPVLGTGLYTNTSRPDYLTFEEGLATTVEEMMGDEVPKWTAIKLGHYINVYLAEQGADFRDVFETAWRYRLLANLGNNTEVTSEQIDKEKRRAYLACVRIFRGMQPDLQEKTGVSTKPLTFNKDLAYLEGRVLAMRHLEELYENKDAEGLARLFAGKYDPTNPVQAKLAEKYAITT